MTTKPGSRPRWDPRETTSFNPSWRARNIIPSCVGRSRSCSTITPTVRGDSEKSSNNNRTARNSFSWDRPPSTLPMNAYRMRIKGARFCFWKAIWKRTCFPIYRANGGPVPPAISSCTMARKFTSFREYRGIPVIVDSLLAIVSTSAMSRGEFTRGEMRSGVRIFLFGVMGDG